MQRHDPLPWKKAVKKRCDMVCFELTGDIEWYLATGDTKGKKQAEQFMDCLVKDDGSLNGPVQPEDLLALVYWFRETKKEKYEKALLRAAECEKKMINAMPFFMAYDTEYCKKEHYSSIVTDFYGLTELSPYDLVALADTIGQMSEEIYEHYCALTELLKKHVRKSMSGCGDRKAQILTGYAALKGYNLSVLQNEAYLLFGINIWKLNAECADDREAGIMKKFHAQYLLLGK